MIENVPLPFVPSNAVSTLPSIPTCAFPSVSPIWLAARSSFAANSYAFVLEITDALVSSIPLLSASFITVTVLVPTENVPPLLVASVLNALISAKSAFTIVAAPVPESTGAFSYHPALIVSFLEPTVSLPVCPA